MNDLVRRILDMILRVSNFGQENSAAIAVNAVAVAKFEQIDDFIAQITEQGTLKMSAIEMKISQSARRKMTRGELKKDLYEFADAGRTAKKLDPNFDNVFVIPRDNLNDATLLATARSFHQSASIEAVGDALKAAAMPDDFLTDLQNDINAFEDAISKQDTAERDRIDAVAMIDDALPHILEAVSILKSIVPRIFRNDAGKLADWTSASHVEKPPKKSKPPTA